jgi:hypothetical protein
LTYHKLAEVDKEAAAQRLLWSRSQHISDVPGMRPGTLAQLAER